MEPAMTTRPLSPVNRRLAPLLLSMFTGGIALWVPVEKLFADEIGFTPSTLGLMAACYAGVVPVLEIPSGILADRWSRRGVLMVGNLGAFASVLVGGLSTNVGMYLVAALLLGVYFAMQSGTADAIVYDTVLEETGSSATFERTLGRFQMVSSAALVLGALGGGVLAAATSPRMTYFATLPMLVVSTLALLAFREPTLHEHSSAVSLRRHVADTVASVQSRPQLRPIVGLLMSTSLLTQAVFEFGPLWLLALDAGTGFYGIAWAMLMASLGIGGALAGRLRTGTARGRALIAGVLAASGATLIVSTSPVVVTVAQVALATLAVAIGVTATRLLHDQIESSIRSSVSSGVGAASWVIFVPFALVFGVAIDRLGIHAGGWLLAIAAVSTSGLLVAVSRQCAPQAGMPSPCAAMDPEPVGAPAGELVPAA
jgi:MFS family permease